ncbi:hypothetical protein LTR78_008174 [Recurvomyces mirabilis]|uniref:Peptidase A1 domain-containing protein n=1 Tax=Recurvomyces mirabilis TaxID=574656 RepID=A0AAE0WHT9_9PEZI|nr:hypothetical protein LTR78_008174 [Recurvomyces mirabilis]KAK5150627.1 hypothetical protein LTS14_009910 [Recurvomyces mirabilis]
MVAINDFKASYGDDDTSEGTVAENISLDDYRLRNITVGLAKQGSPNPIGIIGLGSPMGRYNGTYGARSDVLESMVDQGLIKTHSFAMYMGEHPSIVFGGYDTSKFAGRLTEVPLQPNLTGSMDNYRVNITSLGVTHSNESSTQLSPAAFSVNAMLDSGTEVSFLPLSLLHPLAAALRPLGVYDSPQAEDEYLAPCTIRDQPGGLEIDLLARSKDQKAQFRITYCDLFDVAYNNDESGEAIVKDGILQCQLRVFGTAEQNTIGLNLQFMRSNYVVHNMDELVLGIAQAVESSGDPDLRDIWPGEKFSMDLDLRQQQRQ